MATRTALVLGSTGLVGTHLVATLAQDPAYDRVVCLVRRPSIEGAFKANERVHERIVDFEKVTEADLEQADDLFCTIGTTMKKAGSREAFRWVDHDVPLKVAKFAYVRGVKRVALCSSVGADAASESFYLRTKGELESALAALPFHAVHVMRPSLLLGDRQEKRPGEAIGAVAARAASGLMLFGLRKWRPVDARLVARAMVAAMFGPDPQPALRIHEYDDILRLSGVRHGPA